MKSLLVLISFVSFSALANGNRIGNGGDVIKCPGKEAQVLDFFESSRLITERTKDPMQILKDIFENLKKLHPNLGSQYGRRADAILNEIEWSAAPLKDIQDSDELFEIPKGCTNHQAAIRKIKKSPLGKNFVFDKGVWDSLSATQKAGLLSHEIIYEHFSKLGEKNSRKAREFNAFLFSDDLQKSTGPEIRRILEKFEIPVE